MFAVLERKYLGQPAKSELQKSSLERTNAHNSFFGDIFGQIVMYCTNQMKFQTAHTTKQRKFAVGKREQDQDTPRFQTVLESLVSVKSIPLEEHADIYALSQAEPGTPACRADVGATGSPTLPTHQCQSGCPSPAC